MTSQPRALSSNANVLRLRIDTIPWSPSELRLLSMLIRDDRGYVPMICLEVYEDAVVLPEAYRSLEREIASVIEAIEPWLDANPQGAIEYRVSADPTIDAIDHTVRAIPGLSAHDVLRDALDRFRAVTAFAASRRVTVYADGVAFGIEAVRAVARAITFVPLEPELAARFDVTVDDVSQDASDCVVAVGIDAALVAPLVPVMRAALGPGGSLVVAAQGAGARDALEQTGLTVTPLRRLVMDAYRPFVDEFVGTNLAPHVAIHAPSAIQPACVDPRPLRVLFILRATTDTATGDVTQVRRTAEELRLRGHRVEITQAFEPEIPTDIDILHLSNLTIPTETLRQIRRVETFPGPIVMMPIFTDHADETAWGLRVWPLVFALGRTTAQFENYLDLLAKRAINAVLDHHGGPVAPPTRIDLEPNYTAMQREIVARCDYLIGNAQSEVHRIYRYLDETIPYAIAPSAVDGSIYGREKAAAFRKRYALGDFVLSMGRIEERKNQLLLAQALRNRDYRLVMIGKNHSLAQAHLMHAYLPSNVVLFGEMPETELAGLVAAARVVALPSWDEVVSLSSLNAAISEASMVLTRNSGEHEYFRDDAEYCDPASVASIAAAVDRAWTSHDERTERRAALAARVRTEYTWAAAAEATEIAYHRVMASNPRGAARVRRFTGA